MRFEWVFGILIMLLACGCAPAVLVGQASGPSSVTKLAAEEVEMLQPSDLFPDFPGLRWEMSLQEAKETVEKAGAHPIVSGGAERRLTWDGKFGGMDGRATILFKKDSGIYEIAVLVYALDKRQEVFAQMSRKIGNRHGETKEVSDTSIDTSKVWRLKNGFTIELRLIKDDDSPVVDVHWVRE
jgi:hypothetical protein